MKTRKFLLKIMLTASLILLAVTSCDVMPFLESSESDDEICAAAAGSSDGVQLESLYVSTEGNDDHGNGDIDNPLLTISCALMLAQPGDTIILRGEPSIKNNRYKENVHISNPDITIRSETDEWAIIECSTKNEDSCVRFDPESSGSKLQRVEIIGGYYGIKFETTFDEGKGEGVSNILIEDVKVHDTADATIKVTPGCDDITIRHVEVYNSGRVQPGSAEGVDNVNGDRMRIQNSYIHDIEGTGVYFKGGATDCLVEGTFIERTSLGGIFIGFDTSPEFFDLSVNPDYYESIGGMVRNNIIRDVAGAGIGLFGAKNAQVYNNTVINTAREFHAPIFFGITYQDWEPEANRPASVNPIIRNNLVFQSKELPFDCISINYDADDEIGEVSGLEGMPVMEHNLFYHAGEGCTFSDERPNYELDQGTFAQWQALINGDTFSLVLNPLLLEDGHLSPESPAIDGGTCEAAPAEDFDGDSRPQGDSCDIGADEFLP